MKADCYIDLEKQTGEFRLELIEMLERYCFYIIKGDDAFIAIHQDELEKLGLRFFPKVEIVVFDLLAGYDSIIMGIKNFKRTYELLLPYIERKISVENCIFSYEENYINYIENRRWNKNE